MDILKNLGYAFWAYPAAIMTGWTLVTLVAAWLAPLNRPVSLMLSLHPMVALLTARAHLVSRPPLWMALIFLALGVIPGVGLASLVLLVGLSASMQYHRIKMYRRGQTPQQDIM